MSFPGSISPPGGGGADGFLGARRLILFSGYMFDSQLGG